MGFGQQTSRNTTDNADHIRMSVVAMSEPSSRIGAVPTRRRVVTNDLILVFAVALTARLIWAVLLPPWQAIDETEHFAYANHIAEQGKVPRIGVIDLYPEYSLELQRSLENTAFYPLVRQGVNNVGLIPVPDATVLAPARQFSASGSVRYDSGYSRATPYPPLYYLLVAIPDRVLHTAPIVSRLFAMRAFSGLFGALSCLFAYLTAYELFRVRRVAWCVGLATAFLPASAHIAASLNNDALMDLFAAVLIWLAARAVMRGGVSVTLLMTAVVCGVLLIVTKPTALPVLLITALVIGGIAGRQIWRAIPTVYRRFVPVTTLVAAVAGVGALALLYSVVAPFRSAIQTNILVRSLLAQGETHYSLIAYLRYLAGPLGRFQLWELYWTFWGWFGWGFATLPFGVLYATVPICLVGFAGAALRAIRRPMERRVWWLFLVLIIGQIVFLLIGVEYRLTFSATGSNFGLTGRYLYPVLVPIVIAIIAGWAHLFRDTPRVWRGAVIVTFALQLIGLSAVLTRYYDVMIGWIQ